MVITGSQDRSTEENSRIKLRVFSVLCKNIKLIKNSTFYL